MLRADTHINSGERSHLSASGNSDAVGTRRNGNHLWLLTFVMAACFTASAHAQIYYYYVDCSGANPYEFPTIGSALPYAGPGSVILVTGPCNENVYINAAQNLNIGAWYGQTATINGTVNIYGSNAVFLYGLNVTNPTGDAFDITGSHAVTLDACTANGNPGNGLFAQNLADVTIIGPSSFDNNGEGMNLSGNSSVSISSWAGPTDISNNRGPGVWLTSGSLFSTSGSTTIENNANPAATPTFSAFGISLFGASKSQIGTCYGPNVIQGNQAGGINLQENSEISLWSCGQPYQSLLQGNGPVGITAGLGSQVTLYEDVQISGHSGSGVELWGKSQLYSFGPNLISQNGAAGDPRSAGIVVDGNSEAYLRGGTLSMNEGPGILALVNSSADFTGATFTGNSGGIITCDSSAYMVSDLSAATGKPAAGIVCRTPHNLGNRRSISGGHPATPDVTTQKKKHAWYKAMATPKP